MFRTFAAVAAVSVCLVLWPASALAGDHGTVKHFGPGAPGIGDPYFPLDGNGGYDVKHYGLDVAYDPATDVLRGVATIKARATQNLSSFNLDLEGMTVRSIRVNGRRATWTPRRRRADRHAEARAAQAPALHHRRGLRRRAGADRRLADRALGLHRTPTTARVVAGQPDVAATWYPVNDHPLDKASYTFRITVPDGLEAIANGELKSNRTRRGSTTWVWDAKEPMASYLTTATIGEFDLRAYRRERHPLLGRDRPGPLHARRPRARASSMRSRRAPTRRYKRLRAPSACRPAASELSFWVTRETEPDWDFVFVEAHPVGLG